jgi:hypothetical protein
MFCCSLCISLIYLPAAIACAKKANISNVIGCTYASIQGK